MPRTTGLAAVVWAIGLPALAAPPLAHWGSFTVTPESTIGTGFDLDVLANGPIDKPKTRIQIVRVQYRLKAPTPVRTIADSGDCPAVRAQLAALAGAEAAQLAEPRPTGAVLDGTDIGIDAPLLKGKLVGERMTLKNNEGMEPIEAWISQTEGALKPCWKPAPGGRGKP